MPALLEALDSAYQWEAVRTLCAMAREQAAVRAAILARLPAALRARAPRTRAGAALIYAGLAGGRRAVPRAVPRLLPLLRDRDPGCRAAAVFALGTLQDTRATAPLLRCLRDRDPWVRALACFALRALGDLRATPALLAIARDPAHDAPLPARFPPACAQEVVRDYFNGGYTEYGFSLRVAAVRALGGLGDLRAVPALRALSAARDAEHRWLGEHTLPHALWELGAREETP